MLSPICQVLCAGLHEYLIEPSAGGTIIVLILQMRGLLRRILFPVGGRARVYIPSRSWVWPIAVASLVGLSFVSPQWSLCEWGLLGRWVRKFSDQRSLSFLQHGHGADLDWLQDLLRVGSVRGEETPQWWLEVGGDSRGC